MVATVAASRHFENWLAGSSRAIALRMATGSLNNFWPENGVGAPKPTTSVTLSRCSSRMPAFSLAFSTSFLRMSTSALNFSPSLLRSNQRKTKTSSSTRLMMKGQ